MNKENKTSQESVKDENVKQKKIYDSEICIKLLQNHTIINDALNFFKFNGKYYEELSKAEIAKLIYKSENWDAHVNKAKILNVLDRLQAMTLISPLAVVNDSKCLN